MQTVDSKFTPAFAQCEKHGTWQQNTIVDGVERWHAICPRCSREAISRSLVARASIPLRFQDRRFDNYIATTPNQQAALNLARQYADQFEDVARDGRCLLLLGQPGTGKTHLAAAIAHQIMQCGFSALFVHAYELVSAIRSTWSNSSSRTEDQVVRDFVTVDLLIVDEVGVQYGKEAELIEIFKVLNGRYERVRPVTVISNLNLEGVEQALGVRVLDRLRENGGRVVVFDWESHRARAEPKEKQ